MTENLSSVPAAADLVLALADDELCLGQNHSWWIAVGPFLEEDLAFTCIAQDELGHARSLYSLLTNDPSEVDSLAYRREPGDYRSAHLTELPCHDWSYALARHYLYDTAEVVRWRALENSTVDSLGALARRVILEENVHEHHARSLMTRLLGNEKGQEHLLVALTELAPLAVGLFDLACSTDACATDACAADRSETGSGVASLEAAGVVSHSLTEQRNQWIAVVTETLRPFGLDSFFEALTSTNTGTASTNTGTASTNTGTASTNIDPGRQGKRSNHFGALHQEMIEVYELEPDARW